MYILVSGTKGSYDRPIELGIEGTYATEEEASEDIMKYVPIYKEGIMEAIQNKEEYYQEGAFDCPIYFGYSEKGNLMHFTTGCPADNEYDGDTYSIFKVGE